MSGHPGHKICQVVCSMPSGLAARNYTRAMLANFLRESAFTLVCGHRSVAQKPLFFMQTQIQEISIEQINIYGGTQARVKTNEDAIESYAEEMQRGAVFP